MSVSEKTRKARDKAREAVARASDADPKRAFKSMQAAIEELAVAIDNLAQQPPIGDSAQPELDHAADQPAAGRRDRHMRRHRRVSGTVA
jgi:hypothetical protein